MLILFNIKIKTLKLNNLFKLLRQASTSASYQIYEPSKVTISSSTHHAMIFSWMYY